QLFEQPLLLSGDRAPAAGNTWRADLDRAEGCLQGLGQADPGAADLQRIPGAVAKTENGIQLERLVDPLGQALVQFTAVPDVAAGSLMKDEHELPGQHSDQGDCLADQDAFGAQL